MATNIYRLLVFYLMIILALTLPQNENRGRKLFGGYRIVPKVCQPTNPSRLKSTEPPICMFNYECNRRNGEVVGACMDGFLFGACCQLPPAKTTSPSGATFHTVSTPSFEEIQEIDHVPEVPILLKPDGTPVDTNDQSNTKQTASTPSGSSTTSQMAELEQNFPALLGQQAVLDDLSLPGLLTHSNNNDVQDHQGTAAVNPVTTLLSPDQVLQIADPVDQLPALFSQGIGQNNHSGAETVLLHKNGTVLGNEEVNFEQLFNPVNRSTLSPSTPVTERTSSSTKKMSGPFHYMNTQRVSGTTQTSTVGLVRVPTISHENPTGIKKHDNMDREKIAISHIISILNGSNPSAPVDPPRVTTQQVESTDRTSSVHTWVTIEDTSLPTTSADTFSYTFYKPSTKPPNFYYYDTSSSTTSFKKGTTKPPSYSSYSPSYPSSSSTYNSPSVSYGSSSGGYHSTRPTTNPPAPTVIVLGPLGTEFTTITSPKPLTKRPTPSSIKHSIVTKQPNIGTEITHNISTVISTSPGVSGTSNIISTSYINVDLKEKPSSPSTVAELITKKPTTSTTVSTWPSTPSFYLKPDNPDFQWPTENLTPVQTVESKPISTKKPVSPGISTTNCDEVTAPPDDLSAFPPDRNPSLTDSAPSSQQEKPTIVEGFNNTGYPGYLGSEIVSDNEIPTPSFIEDEVLKNKVDDLVNKIVDSLQGDFQNLEDVVYRRKNATLATTVAPTKKPVSTKRPVGPGSTKRPSKKPSSKPGASTVKPVRAKPSTVSSNETTRKPTNKRPRPTKKVTTQASVSVTTLADTVTHSIVAELNVVQTTKRPSTTPDYRRECGVRPLIRAGRIVGGKGATFGEWPWQVLVRESSWLGLMTKNKCGGVLITDKYVITAAHCQPGFLASLVAVFGEFDISGELEPRRSVTRNVRRVIVNRKYNPVNFENDLALLELESPVQFDAHIVPICMPEDNADFTGQMATVTGWGRVKYNGGVPSLLQEVQVPVMENSVCQELFTTAGHNKKIIESFLCAGYATGEKDSCEGDSGGPLMMERPDGRWQLVGTVSHGIKCAAPFLPGVYMRTTYFKPWLHSITGV
ncbi:serine protease lint [Diachasma alloeum]|uniref:serine protease lint n=1 Tax=Diachasma alloeum TaxID=454923 RepID=UPI0007383C88|nr:serine protease lint [Diachasma alloeum]